MDNTRAAPSASEHWARFLNDLLMQRTKMLCPKEMAGHYSGPDYFTLD